MCCIACSSTITTPQLTTTEKLAKLNALQRLAEQQLVATLVPALIAKAHVQNEMERVKTSFADAVVLKRKQEEKQSEIISTWILPAPLTSNQQEDIQQRLDVEKRWMPMWNKLTIQQP